MSALRTRTTTRRVAMCLQRQRAHWHYWIMWILKDLNGTSGSCTHPPMLKQPDEQSCRSSSESRTRSHWYASSACISVVVNPVLCLAARPFNTWLTVVRTNSLSQFLGIMDEQLLLACLVEYYLGLFFSPLAKTRHNSNDDVASIRRIKQGRPALFQSWKTRYSFWHILE